MLACFPKRLIAVQAIQRRETLYTENHLFGLVGYNLANTKSRHFDDQPRTDDLIINTY